MVNDITRWSDKIFLANGYLTEGIDPATKYLSLVYDKQLSVNEKVEEYIRLRKEEMGLIPTQPADKKVRDIAPEIDGIWGLPDKWLYSTTQTWMGVKPILKHLPDDIQSQYQVNTSPLNSYFTKGGGRISKDNAIIDIAGYALGKTSPETQGIIDFYTKELRNAPLSQWGIIFDRLENKKREMESLVDPAMADITAAKMAELPAKELLKIPSAWSGALAQINAAFDLDGESIFAKQLRGYKEYLADSKQKSLESNWRLFATQGIPSFVSLLNGGTEQDVWNDIITNRGWSPIQQTFVGDNKQSADQYAATFYAAFVKPVYDIMSSFPKDIQSQFAVWLDSPIVKKAIEMNRLRIGKGKEQEEEGTGSALPSGDR